MTSKLFSQVRITPRLTRRDLLVGMAAAGGVAALTSFGFTKLLDRPEEPSEQSIPFFGIHQAGVTTPQPAAAVFVAFDVIAQTKPDLVRLMKTLTERIELLTQGWNPPPQDPRFPPLDSGIAGTEVRPDRLSITVSLGASLFDQRFGLANLKPRFLQPMPNFRNDELDPAFMDGDLMLQFNANQPQTCLHAVRDLLKNIPDLLTIRWKMEGFLPPNTVRHLGKQSIRNLLGFKDGTANLDADDENLMNRVVWVQANSGEPTWATGGTYLVVRIIRNLVERWDRTPLGEQEQIFGRYKASGAPLGEKNEYDPIDYSKDPEGKQIPLDAHIRLANPHKSESDLILRRYYAYSRDATANGQLNQGLLFSCFQANLETGFISAQKRLTGAPLDEYIKPTGGGFFYVLPGITAKGHYLGQSLLEAA